jgi:ribonuclease D
MPSAPQLPPKSAIAELQPFDGLTLDRITVVTTGRLAAAAFEDLAAAGEVGFDTESKPTFRKGEVSGGPHVLQFATRERAYIFQSHAQDCLPVMRELLEAERIRKIGFDLRGDLGHLWNRFQLKPQGVMDLDRSFRKLGYRTTVGAKSAIAMLFQRRLMKSKSLTTSNWANPRLSDSQLLYAANDAYAALRVFHALKELAPTVD